MGVKAVVAKSFERIHRSNLVGMGVLPLEFEDGTDAQTLGLDGTETFSIEGLEGGVEPSKKVWLKIQKGADTARVPLLLRIDTPIEASFYGDGGILPFVLKKITGQ